MSKINYILIVLMAVGLSGVAFLYFFGKKTKDAGSVKADYEYSINEFASLVISTDDEELMQLYGGRVIELEGEVSEIISNQESYDLVFETNDPFVSVNVNLVSEMSAKVNDLSVGDLVRVRAFFSGKLIDIELTRGVIID
jgi:hypothetical protein